MLAPAPSGAPALLHWGTALGDLVAGRPRRRSPPCTGPASRTRRSTSRGCAGSSARTSPGSPASPGSRASGRAETSAPGRRGSPAGRCTVDDDERRARVRLDGIGRRGGLGRRRRARADPRGAGPAAADRDQRRRRRPAAARRARRAAGAGAGRPSCSTSPAAGAASGRPSDGRGCSAPTCARAGTAAPATTRPCSWRAGTPGLRLRSRRGLGRARRLERRPHDVRRTDAGGRVPARRRRAARTRRGACSAPGATYAAPVAGRRLLRRRARRRQRPDARLAAPALPAHAADPPGAGQHLGGDVLRPRPRPARPSSPGAAAEVGVERFVLDDGWFRGRRHDRAGLGDWTVDPDVWPEGLHPLVDEVKRLGHGLRPLGGAGDGQRGLRPRARPPRLGAARPRRPARPSGGTSRCSTSRCPDAYAHVRDALLRLLEEYDIALPQVGPQPRPDRRRPRRATGRPRTDAGVLPAARRAARPRIPTWRSRPAPAAAAGSTWRCSPAPTGSGRRTPSTRSSGSGIQRWTSLLVPPEMLGTHIGGPVAHTTGRTHRLEFRAATALLGHFGIEWDLRGLDADDRARVAAWVALHKRVRPVLAERHAGARRPSRPRPAGHRRRRRPTPPRPGTSWPRSTLSSPSPRPRCCCPGSTRPAPTG